MAWLIFLLIAGLVILIAGGEFLVRGASNIAYSLRISPLVVGLTIVAFGTSAPELLISTTSAIQGETGLAMGNVVGSNICNLSLVLGITALFYPIVVSDNSIKVDWLVTMGASLCLFFFVNEDQTLVRYEGVIFIVSLIVYTYFLIEMSRKETKERISQGLSTHEEDAAMANTKLPREILFILIGIAGLFFGADMFVDAVLKIAAVFEIPKDIVGLTVVALGTSLPELVTSAIAAYKKNTDLAIGNLLGSCIFNILSILGITSLIKDVDVTPHLMEKDMLWMLAITLLVLPMMISRRKIGRVEGALLLGVYAWYMYNLASSPIHLEDHSSEITSLITNP